MVSRLENRLELYNEWLTNLIFLHLLFFTEWIPTLEQQYTMGWSMIIHILLFLIINFYFIFRFMFRSSKLYFIKYKNIYMAKFAKK